MKRKNNIPCLTREEIKKGNLKLQQEEKKMKLEDMDSIREIEKKVEEFRIRIITFYNEAYEESAIDWSFDSEEREWVGYRKLEPIDCLDPATRFLEYHLTTSELIGYVYQTPPAINYLSFQMIGKKYSHLILYKTVNRNWEEQWVYEIVSSECDRMTPNQYGNRILYQLNCLCNTIDALKDLDEDEIILNMGDPFYDMDEESIQSSPIYRVIDDLNKVGFLDQCYCAIDKISEINKIKVLLERVVRCLEYAPNIIAPTSLQYRPFSQYEIEEGGLLQLKWFEKEQKDCYPLHLAVHFNPTLNSPNVKTLFMELFVYDRRKIVWEYHERMEGIICGKENRITPEYHVSDFLIVPQAIIRYACCLVIAKPFK